MVRDTNDLIKDMLRDIEKIKETVGGRPGALDEYLALSTEVLDISANDDALNLTLVYDNFIEDMTANNHGTGHNVKTTVGKIGTGLYFDSVIDYVEVPTSVVGGGDILTIKLWVKLFYQDKGAPYYDHSDIIRSQCYGNGTWGICTDTGFNTSNRLSFQVGWITGYNQWWNPVEATVTKDDWTLLELRLDRTTGKATFYRNGSFVVENTFTVGTKPVTTGFRVGSDCAGSAHMIADEVMIYHRALTPEERTADYNGGAGYIHTSPYDLYLKAYYRFEDTGVIPLSITSASYIIYKLSATTFAYNCATGELEYNDTNSGNVINYAINQTTSGTVHIKSGTYYGGKITGKSGITIEGEGRDTIYQLANGSNETTLDVGGDNVVIKDLTLDGNKAGQTGGAIVLDIENRSNIKVLNCWIKNAKDWDNINIDYSNNVQVIGCEIQDSGGFGIRLYHCYDVLILGNRIHGNADINVTADTSTRLRIVNNYSYGCPMDGFALDWNSTYCVLSGNVAYSNNHFGISVDACLSPYLGCNTVNFNIVYNNGWEGINIMRSSYNTIGHNFCRNNGQNGGVYSEIFVHQVDPSGAPSKYNVVSGNTVLIDGATKCSYGIAEGDPGDTECDYNIIAENVVQGGGTGNIIKRGANTILEHNIA